MKRLLLAAGLALACHGALFVTGSSWFRSRWDQKHRLPRAVTVTLEYRQVPKVEPKPVEKTPEIQPKKSPNPVKKKEGELSRKKFPLSPPLIKVQKSPKELPRPKQQRKKVTRPKQERDRSLHPKKKKPAEVIPKGVPAPKPDHPPKKETQFAQTDEVYDALAVPEQDYIQGEGTTAKPTEQIASEAPQ